MINKKHLLGLLIGAALFSGCEEPCERTTRTVNDLNKAKALLEEGLRDSSKWNQVCDTLVMSSDAFRDDADFVRKVADERYRGIPAGCAQTGYVEYCRGGWYRNPYGNYPYSSLEVDGFGELPATFVADASNDLTFAMAVEEEAAEETAEDQSEIAADRRSGGRSGGSSGRSGGNSGGGNRQTPSRPSNPSRPTPSRPDRGTRPAPSRPTPAPSRPDRGTRPTPTNPRPAPRPVPGHPDRVRPRPVPRPVPGRPHARPVRRVYPRHYPRHTRWYWHYQPRYCSLVPVCYRYESGRPKHPGYEQVQALAYELDQAAGGIETVCTKAHDAAPVEEINTTARETLTRIEQQGLPQTQLMFDNLGCSTKSGRSGS